MAVSSSVNVSSTAFVAGGKTGRSVTYFPGPALPNTRMAARLYLDERGFVKTGGDLAARIRRPRVGRCAASQALFETNVPRVFAFGGQHAGYNHDDWCCCAERI